MNKLNKKPNSFLSALKVQLIAKYLFKDEGGKTVDVYVPKCIFIFLDFVRMLCHFMQIVINKFTYRTACEIIASGTGWYWSV